jgi:hypothetical protein
MTYCSDCRKLVNTIKRITNSRVKEGFQWETTYCEKCGLSLSDVIIDRRDSEAK